MGDEEIETTSADEPDSDVFETPEDVVGDVPSATESLRYFGADFDVEGIVRRLESRNFVVPSFNPPPAEAADYAGFQRNFIWKKSQKDRFIESLLMGYPVPGIFLVERPNREYLVLDGQQRMRTLHDFIKGVDSITERTFRLNYVSEDAAYHGKSFDDLGPADQNLLKNTFIQATVVIPKRRDHLQGVYQLFERINSGGTNLQPQEIRIALYAGKRVDALRAMNENTDWRKLFGKPHSRLKDTELILRYLALRRVASATQSAGWDRDLARTTAETLGEVATVYRAPLNQFLNSYLEAIGEDKTPSADAIQAFDTSCALLAPLEKSALRLDEDANQINAAHADAVLVGLSLSPAARRNDRTAATQRVVAQKLAELKADQQYSTFVRESTSHASSIYGRLKIATEAFEGI